MHIRRLRELLLSLHYLHKNVRMHPWPILLMYSDDMDDSFARKEFELRLYAFIGDSQDARWFVERLEWVALNWALPDTIPHNKEEVDPIYPHVWPGTTSALDLDSVRFDH